jgi:hypothetical protein
VRVASKINAANLVTDVVDPVGSGMAACEVLANHRGSSEDRRIDLLRTPTAKRNGVPRRCRVRGGHWHLWRQRYPDGQAQQITFGPTDEETVACAPDGRSLLTSLGREQSTIWLHAAGSERVLTTENYASSPWLSPDADRVYFLAARSSAEPSELWRLEVASGRKQSLLAGFAVSGYDISPDERQVVFTTTRDGAS